MKFFKLFIVLIFLFTATWAAAEEETSLELSVPANLASDACKIPAWSNVQAVWHGIIDARTSPELGLQTQKGKETIKVVSSIPLQKFLEKPIKDIFTSCGMKFIEDKGDNLLHLSAEIREFYVGVEKKLVTGKSVAKSEIAFTARRGGQSSTISVGYEIESKKIRSGNIKQLKSTLDDLLATTLKRMVESKDMREIK